MRSTGSYKILLHALSTLLAAAIGGDAVADQTVGVCWSNSERLVVVSSTILTTIDVPTLATLALPADCPTLSLFDDTKPLEPAPTWSESPRVFLRPGKSLYLGDIFKEADIHKRFKLQFNDEKGGKLEFVVNLQKGSVGDTKCEPHSAAEPSPEKVKKEDLESYVKEITQALAEFEEEATVTIDAATGIVVPDKRIRIRRGHYVRVRVLNGWLYDIDAEVLSEWGNRRTDAESTEGADIGITGEIACESYQQGVARLANAAGLPPTDQRDPKALLSAASSITNNAEIEDPQRKADARELSQLVQERTRHRACWLRAAYRETVFRLTVVPFSVGTGQIDRDASGVKDVVLTMNAQKWGVGAGAGFMFAVDGEKRYRYQLTADGQHKMIVEKSGSEASPLPAVFLNFFMWERPQWSWSMGFALEGEDQRPSFSLGASYLFSGHGQVTGGVALVPMSRLPGDLEAGDEVPLTDTTLDSLDWEYEARFFIGLGWRFDSRKDPAKPAETEPTGASR